MTNKKSTKRALIASVISLLLCFTMLMGTTYAWFTDSVTSANNIITTGNLDVELYHTDKAATKEKVTSTTELFDDVELWEPGAVVYETLEVVNEGTLALKYQLSVNVANATATTDGKTLADVLKVGVIDGGATITDRDALIGEVKDWSSLASFTKYGKLDLSDDNNKSDTYTVVIYWEPSENDNDYNMNNGKTDTDGKKSLQIEIGVNLYATQMESENDSFGNDYDKGLMVDAMATPETIQEIIYAAEPGDIIGLEAGNYDKLVLSQANGDGKDGITLLGTTGAVVGVLDLHRSSNIVIDGITFDASNTEYTVSSFDGTKRSQHSNILDMSTGTDSKGSNKGVQNITIQNCTFTGTADDVENYVAICLYEQRRSSGPAHDVTVDNCTFALDAQQYIGLNYLEGGVVTVTNNTFGGVEYKTYHNAINASSNGSSWVVTDNTFYNWNPEKALFGSSYNGATKVTISLENNVLVNYRAETVNVLNIKNSYNDSNLELIYQNNTANDGLYEFSSDVVVDGNDNLYQIKATSAVAFTGDADAFNTAISDPDVARIVLSENYTWDASTPVVIESGVKKTIDLNGNTLAASGTQQLFRVSGGELTLTNGDIELTSIYNNISYDRTTRTYTGGGSLCVENNGVLTISDGVNISASGTYSNGMSYSAYGYVILNLKGTVNIEGGNFDLSNRVIGVDLKGASSGLGASATVTNSPVVNISGGTFKATDTAILASMYGTANVTGGTFDIIATDGHASYGLFVWSWADSMPESRYNVADDLAYTLTGDRAAVYTKDIGTPW